VSDNPNLHYTVYPLTLFHPVFGAVTVDNQEAAQKLFHPARDWFPTAAEADAHRTEREAQMVIHNTRRMQVDDMAAQYEALVSGDPDAAQRAAAGMHEGVEERDDGSPVPDRGTVTHSVAFEEVHVKPQRAALLKSDADKQAENDAVAKAAADRHADDADVQHVVVDPSTQTAISG
jgi:hypothetical protein